VHCVSTKGRACWSATFSVCCLDVAMRPVSVLMGVQEKAVCGQRGRRGCMSCTSEDDGRTLFLSLPLSQALYMRLQI